MNRIEKIIALLICVGLIGFELMHTLQQKAWGDYNVSTNYIVGPLVLSAWLVAAISIFMKKDKAFLGSIIGASAALLHGILIRVGGSFLGNIFVVVGAVLLLISLRSAYRKSVNMHDAKPSADTTKRAA